MSRTLDHPCPRCLRLRGEWCITASGNSTTDYHIERRALADPSIKVRRTSSRSRFAKLMPHRPPTIYIDEGWGP